MNKKIILITIILGLTIGLSGCKDKKQDNIKRIVIEEDIGADSKEKNESKNTQDSKVADSNFIESLISEQIELELEEGYYFYPSFYYQGEVYGYISKGQGMSRAIDRSLESEVKMEYLYKIDEENNLVKTSKVYHDYFQGHSSKIYPQNTKFINYVKDTVFTVDYTKEDRPKPWPELTDVVNKLKGESRNKLYFIELVLENENYLIINEILTNSESNWKKIIYIYDIESNKLYTMKNGERDGKVCYVDALQSLVWVDHQDFKIFKIVLENGYYDLEEYADLNRYGKADEIRAVMKDNDEMLLFMDTNIGKNLFKTTYVGKFNFKNNLYYPLLEVSSEVNIYSQYIGKDILLIEEFKMDDSIIIPMKSYFKQIRYNEMNTIFEEEFKDESEQWYLNNWTVISEDGKEVFDAREINKMKDVITTEKIIYQRLYIKK